MCNQLVRKVEGDERDVFMSIQVTLTSGDDGLGTLLDEVVHDRKVMRGQIPDDVDVMLEEAKIHPHGIVVIEISERILIQKFTDFSDRRCEQEGMVHHDLQVLFFRKFDEFFCLRCIAGKRFLDKDVLTILQRGFCQLVMRPYRCHHSNRIDVRGRQHLCWIRNNLNLREILVSSLSCGYIEVTKGNNLGFVQMFQVPNNFRAPIAVSDDSESYDLTSLFLE